MSAFLPTTSRRRKPSGRAFWACRSRSTSPGTGRPTVSTSFSEANQINHICLEVNSLDEAVAAIRTKGVSITDKKLGVDDTWQAWTADPNGVKIELFEYTPRSAQFVGGDRVANW